MSGALEQKVDNLVEVTTKLVVMQEQTTKNIDKLALEIKDTMCESHECDAVKREIDYLKDKTAKLEGKIETIEGVPNAVAKRALMTAVAATVMYLMYTIGISK